MEYLQPFNIYMQSFWDIHDIHLAVRDDYDEQATSDNSAPSFHINASYMFVNGQRILDILVI